MDFTKLTLNNMIFYGYHGVYGEERKLGQLIAVDVEMVSDLSKAGLQDDLRLTVNYAEVYDPKSDRKRTIQINRGIAFASPVKKVSIKRIVVRVRKPHPPIGGLMDAARLRFLRNCERR